MTPSFTSTVRAVREHLGQERRFAHTLAVARLADTLAQRHGESPVRARTAGLLHDLARLYPAERLLLECRTRGIPVDEFAAAHPIVLHAPLGAAMARERFGVDDECVLSAIRKHTLGAAQMSRLDCIVYLADGLEPGRAFAERAALLALARTDLRGATLALLQSSKTYLEKRGLAVAPQTLAALDDFAEVNVA